ncbi:50S ribosomal protein L25 [Anatilimnocola floriformis]|uniref:50S ribosomal protein L25 n=1 Tax=Anatilimnocola floriformis TaxID=2948575 RepID=UPI0020C31609|nr:50S ribosomal protein L25 [Anatilimnocola floriformis]
MSDTLVVKKRAKLGTSATRRLRWEGSIPVNLYGHGEANASLAVPLAQVVAVIKHGGKLVKLSGDITETALLREVQWDTYSKEIIHIDLLRVSEKELVETTVAVELKGTAPGTGEGGVLQFVLHELHIECPAISIPEKLYANINDLHLGKAIHASDIQLPEGAKLASDPHLVIVSCVAPHKEEETAAGLEGTVEPELIRKEKTEEDAAE